MYLETIEQLYVDDILSWSPKGTVIQEWMCPGITLGLCNKVPFEDSFKIDHCQWLNTVKKNCA